MPAPLLRSLLASIVTLSAFPALAQQCVLPETPGDLPVGSTATRAEMLAAQTAIRAYDAAVNQYVACLGKEGRDPEKGNAAVARLKRLADQFNAELRVFKGRGGAQ